MLISIDIGSTWTKGALFSEREGLLFLERREATATTSEDLSLSFNEILNRLKLTAYGQTPILCSSSAHGGLKIIAIGIVPDLTLESARMAALSAGGKLMKAYSYRLNKSDIEEIEKSDPDIILLTGGTDGGNRSYSQENAQLLSESKLECTILYAGNRDLQDKIKEIFKSKDLLICSNVLPELDNPSPEEARDMVREAFMTKIIQGKGLQSIVELTGQAPLPTPAAVFDYIRILRDEKIIDEDFALIDMGGATTDVYTSISEKPEEQVIHKGIREPEVKRSVEGDLGMRISALSALEIQENQLNEEIKKRDLSWNLLEQYGKKIIRNTDFIPETETEKQYDSLLARLCVSLSTVRHSGTRREIYTTSGKAIVEKGRNLKEVKTIIGTGGYFANVDENPFSNYSIPHLNEKGEEILNPQKFNFYRDQYYLIPLLANAARLYPKEAAASLRANLKKSGNP